MQLLNSKNGITAPLILAVVVIVLVVGAGIFFIRSNSQTTAIDKPNTPQSSETEPAEEHSEPIMQNNQFKMEGQNSIDTTKQTQNPDVVVQINAENFSFDKKEIRVKQGQIVKIVLTSTEGFHDWVVDEFSAATEEINTGQTTEVIFTADKKGIFEYYCSVGSHRQFGMVGNLIVE